MTYDSRLQLFGPVELTNRFEINLPEQLGGAGQTIAFGWQSDEPC